MKNSQKGFAAPILIIISILIIGGIAVYTNKNKIFGNSALSTCVIEENRGNTISPNVAQAVALDQVNKNNTPFNWVSVGYYPIYRSSGEINYYAFVFRKTEYTKFTTLDSLEQNASKYSDTTQDGGDKKYQFNDIALVLTGAANGDALIIRHNRGIPEIVGKKVEIKNYVENKYPNKTIGNIISDSPMGKMYFEIVNKSNNVITGEVIGLDYVVTSVKNEKSKKYMSLDQKECNSYKQALIEREADRKNQWGKYTQ
jgi:hypothetical protein